MPQPTIKYLLIAITFIAICLAIHQIPLPSPIAVLAGEELPERTISETVLAVIGAWPIRLAAFILGISTLMHVATTLLGLNTWLKWLIATTLPTAGIIGWYVIGVRFLGHHPGSIGVYGFLVGGLFWFPIGFAFVSAAFAGLRTINGTHKRTSIDT